MKRNAVLVILIALFACAAGAEPITLEYKFKVGDVEDVVCDDSRVLVFGVPLISVVPQVIDEPSNCVAIGSQQLGNLVESPGVAVDQGMLGRTDYATILRQGSPPWRLSI